jgi:hypothetical protein|tara:strand:- start:836 stop:1069 length:234 start_codon:yes stop_codon:yes gene_type:complete
MACHIKVYLFSDAYKYLNENKILEKVSKDTETEIKFINKKTNSYITIEGKYEPSHKARIILQDIEKEIYRIAGNALY